MTFRELVNGYLDEAWSEHPAEDAGAYRLDYLKREKSALWEEVKSGDWSETQSGYEGASASFARGLTAQDRYKAVTKAIELLTADATTTKMTLGIIIPKYYDTPTG
ncbi:MAG TPA: hypothetical protein VIG24_08220 [Acidimicrobiia bacterium]|jgi:hypothetical protein